MHKNYVWLALLSLLTGAVGWITLKALYLVYLYVSLNAAAPAENIQWSVDQLSEDRFALKANYTFKDKDQDYKGETVISNDIFWNPWVAEEALKVYSEKEWLAWYSSNNPEYSSLQKNFPLKECISAAVLWLLLLYFFSVGYYVATRNP